MVASTGALSVASWAQVKVSVLGYYFDALNTPYVRGVVLATDVHGLVAEASLTINVLDVSDLPQFELSTYSASVMASAPFTSRYFVPFSHILFSTIFLYFFLSFPFSISLLRLQHQIYYSYGIL